MPVHETPIDGAHPEVRVIAGQRSDAQFLERRVECFDLFAVVGDYAILPGAEQHLAGGKRQNGSELPVTGLDGPDLTEPAIAEDHQAFSRGCDI